MSLCLAAFLIGAAAPPPITEMRVVYRVPGMDQVLVRRNLVYRSVGEARLSSTCTRRLRPRAPHDARP